MAEYIILRNRDFPDIHKLDVYRENGGYEGLAAALKKKPEEVTAIVKDSGLQGRGGAAFPTGVKWGFIPKDVFPRYVVANADESEPGTFKDREIIEKNPHQLIEGIAIACYAVQANTAYIYCRGEFKYPARILEEAIQQARKAGYLGKNVMGSDFSLEIYTHLGAGAYICGEETALLESLEGKLGQPRQRPPFPAVAGLYGKPTVINNVETLANIPPILIRGAEWYRTIGTEKSPGPKIFCLSGHVNRPGNYELPLGTSLRELIYEHGGGVREDRQIKAILPAGASAPLLTAEHLDVALDYESVVAAGSMLGSASIIVMDETTDMVWLTLKTSRFFRHESCGKCTPCREGTYWLVNILERIEHGQGTREDIALLERVANQIALSRPFCLLGDFATTVVLSGLKYFREEYENHIGEKLALSFPAHPQPLVESGRTAIPPSRDLPR
ncbi:MAG: NADH-quinone oxidoreductase subunit NuoF [Chloroflexi bacterium]|nr:NADH-quinone oxidoreductase subunit NuoF [Chloroflexota bacterium]